jgi:hypothetical protein
MAMPKPLHKSALAPKDGPDRALKVFGIVALILAAGIPFLLGKYFELNYPDPFDSAIYVYSAQHILHGAKIGVEEVPSAQIGTLLVNLVGVALFGFNETGPKLIQGLLQIAAFVMMFIALRKLFGRMAAAVSVIVASFYLSAPVIAKFGNVKEQHMIAFMVMGISCFILYQLAEPGRRRRWIWAVLAGAFLSWGPLFKQTGMSAIGAVGLFVVAQPILRHRTFKQTGIDILLLLGGAAAALAPLYIWIIGWGVQMPLPYEWVGLVFAKLLPAVPAAATAADPNAAPGDSYLTGGRKLVSLSSQAAMVFRYYRLLILPVGLAVVAIVLRLLRLIPRRRAQSALPAAPYDRFVLLLAAWWLLDMVFVWISPRPYEQYYLPLNASAAMLGAYGIAVYHAKVKAAVYQKSSWAGVGVGAAILMLILAYPIVAGIKVSPATGVTYTDYGTKQSIRSRGYAQKLDEIERKKVERQTYAWEQTGDYIRERSQETDEIYVWGWIPGIYVRSQRFSPAPAACTSEMHVYSPALLSKVVGDLLTAFQKTPPRFIVDTHNRHFPYDPPRPPLELWPTGQKGLVPAEPNTVPQYETLYFQMLDQRKDLWPDEAARFVAMKPLRDYLMAHYRPVQAFGDQVVFERKTPVGAKEAP